MTVTLAPVSAAHAGLLAALHAQCFREAWSEGAMAGLLSLPTTFGFVAVRADEPCGFVLASLAGGESEILSIAVVPARRGSGIGTVLLAAAVETARAAGADRMFLEVAAGDPAALALYRAGGFAPAGRRANYYGSGVDALLMSRRLEA